MKIVTIGMSPYLLTSQSKIHSTLLRHLYQSGHSVAGIVSNHDIAYFLPKEDKDGNQRYYYDFDDHSIPVVPLGGKQDLTVQIYEILNQYQPDLVVTIGDCHDVLYMKAVKMFVEKPFKWLAVMMNYSYPINENHAEITEDMDGIFCLSEFSYNMMKDKFPKETIAYEYIGCESNKISQNKEKNPNIFRLMVSGKNMQIDNIPMVMECVSKMRDDIPNLELYVHANIYDKGDYDLTLLKQRFDPNNEFIKFPEKYVSLTDGYSDEEYKLELMKSDIFVSVPYNAASALSVFEAMSCGCIPLLSDLECYREIYGKILGNNDFEKEDFLVSCIEVMVRGEMYINICNPEELKGKILNLYQKRNKKGGDTIDIREFVNDTSRKKFLDGFSKMVSILQKSNTTICVESV